MTLGVGKVNEFDEILAIETDRAKERLSGAGEMGGTERPEIFLSLKPDKRAMAL